MLVGWRGVMVGACAVCARRSWSFWRPPWPVVWSGLPAGATCPAFQAHAREAAERPRGPAQPCPKPRREDVHRWALQIHGHLRAAQRSRECEAQRREQLLQPITGDDDATRCSEAPTFADPHAPALAFFRHVDEFVSGRAAPGLQVGRDRREPVDEQRELIPHSGFGQRLVRSERDRGVRRGSTFESVEGLAKGGQTALCMAARGVPASAGSTDLSPEDETDHTEGVRGA